MNIKTYLVTLLLISTFCISCKDDEPDYGPVDLVSTIPLGDPFILYHDNVYYAYGTHDANGIEVYTSQDMQTWKKNDDLALHKDNSYADRWFWAPEIYYIKEQNKFYMYYSADEHICVATSDSPLGPFVQDEKKPMLDEKAIDNSLFIDDNGKAYVSYVKFDAGNQIWIAELENDLKTIKKSTETLALNASQPWEQIWGNINEGSFVIKHQNKYYMTYSANDYQSHNYAIGYAIADSPLGPWTKYDKNPILKRPANLYGVGHSAIFKDKDDKLKMVFHAHHSVYVINPRKMYITDLSFTNDAVPVLQVTGDIIYPKLLK